MNIVNNNGYEILERRNRIQAKLDKLKQFHNSYENQRGEGQKVLNIFKKMNIELNSNKGGNELMLVNNSLGQIGHFEN